MRRISLCTAIVQICTVMEWSDLEVFLTAVRAGSYTAAGRRLNVNRTTVGRRIDALEMALGQSLFEETPLGPAPTPAGRRVLRAAEAAEVEIKAMITDLGAVDRREGPLRIAGSAGIAVEFLPEIVQFRKLYPGVAVELLGELDPIDAVTSRRADLGLALVRTPPLRLAGTQVATLAQARYARRDLTAGAPQLGWGYEVDAALPGSQWTASNPVGEAAERAGIPTFNSWPQLKQATLSGLGSAVLWCFAAEGEPELKQLEPPDPRQDCPLWLVHRGKARPGPALTKFIEFLAVALPKRLTARTEQLQSEQ
jgi:DNA-binding transcriptional LysR family regulator